MTFGAVVGSDSIASTSPGTGIGCATGWTAAVGDLVFVAVGMRVSVPASASIADGLGNTYTPLNTYDGGNPTVSAWYSILTTGGTCKPAITHTSTSNDEALVAIGFQGPFDPGGALDKDVNGVTIASGDPIDCPATGTLARAEELVFGYCAFANGVATLTASSPMSMRKEANSGTGSNTISVHVGSFVVSATDSVTPAMTGTHTTGAAKTATFKGLPPVVGIADETNESSEAYSKTRARTRHFDDSVQQGEVFQRPGSWIRPIPETVDIQRDQKRLLARIRRFADTVSTSEFIDRVRTIFKWRSHTVEYGETNLSFRGLFRVLAETAEGAEAFNKLVVRALPQIFVAWFELQAVRTDIPFIPAILEVIDEMAEAAETLWSGRVRLRPIGESVQQDETRYRFKAVLRRWAASVEQAEAKVKVRARIKRRLEDTWVGEVRQRVRAKLYRIAATVETGETRIIARGKHVVSFATVQVAATIGHLRGRIKSFADTVTYGDIIAKTRGRVRRFADQVSVEVVRIYSIGKAAVVDEMMRLLDNPTFVSTLMFLRPTLTYTSGSWLNELGEGIDIHKSVDEEAPSDADWIVSSSNPDNDIAVFNLIGPQFQLIEPVSLRIRARVAAPSARLTAKIYDGDTEILSREVTGLTKGYQTIVFPLTGNDFIAVRDAIERKLMLIANTAE